MDPHLLREKFDELHQELQRLNKELQDRKKADHQIVVSFTKQEIADLFGGFYGMIRAASDAEYVGRDPVTAITRYFNETLLANWLIFNRAEAIYKELYGPQ